MAAIPPIEKFTSISDPNRWVQYRRLNPGAAHTLLFCYGAGGYSSLIMLYKHFADAHKDLSIMIVDRWTQTKDASKAKPKPATGTAPNILDDLSSITLELLDSLNIQQFSIAGHSAGAYPLLSLIKASGDSPRVKNAFLICTHMPLKYTQSKVMAAMSSMPEWLFNIVNKIDEIDADSPVARAALRMFGSVKDDSKPLVYSGADYERFRAFTPDAEQAALDKARNIQDRHMTTSRTSGIGSAQLEQLYKEIETRRHVKYVWFTSDGDIFFGPQTVARVLADVDNPDVEVVNVEGATHAHVFYRTDVWERMYQETVGQ